MSTVEEETYDEDDEDDVNVDGAPDAAKHKQTPPKRSPTRMTTATKDAAAAMVTAAGRGSTANAASASNSVGGGAGSGGGPTGYERGRRGTTGDARPASPKRSVAVVRRQSVSKVGGRHLRCRWLFHFFISCG